MPTCEDCFDPCEQPVVRVLDPEGVRRGAMFWWLDLCLDCALAWATPEPTIVGTA